MKPSGIEWIGDIPDDWEVLKYKYAGRFEKGKLPKFINRENKGSPVIGASEMNGGLPILFTEDSDIPKCRKDDVLFLWDGANAGLVSSGLDGILSSTVVKYVCTNSINIKYLFYLTKYYEKYFKSKVNGTTIPHMSYDFINDCPLLEPPLRTQQRIADYLDEKCGEIDATIAKQKESIEKLKAYKQSLISETVTKGLDKSAPLKPSGIKWLGEISQNARIIRLRFLSSIQTGDKDTANRVENGKYPFYVRSPIVERIDTFSFDGEAILMAGDGVGAGKVFHYVNGKFDYHQRVYNIHNLKGVLGKFLYYYLRENFYKEIEQSNAKSTVDSIRLPMLLDFPIIVYPYDLQKKIVSFLDKKVTEIDVIIIKKQNIIQKLDAYKKSLIFEYVTGKRLV